MLVCWAVTEDEVQLLSSPSSLSQTNKIKNSLSGEVSWLSEWSYPEAIPSLEDLGNCRAS